MSSVFATPSGVAVLSLVLLPLAASQCTADCKTCSDSSGTKWDLSSLKGAQTATSSADSFTYAFDVCENINPLPDICNTYGVYGSCAVQYDDDPFSGSCTQLGPDLSTTPDGAKLTQSDAELQVDFAYSSDSLRVTLKCDKGAGVGKPGQITVVGTQYQVEWATAAVCADASGSGGLVPSASSGWFGHLFLWLFFPLAAVYAGGGYVSCRDPGRPLALLLFASLGG